MRDSPGGKPLSVLLRGVPGIRVLGPLGGGEVKHRV
jgi:hypothetical protein